MNGAGRQSGTSLPLSKDCEANPAGENSSSEYFYSLCQISSTLCFKLAYVILHMAVKEFFETHF